MTNERTIQDAVEAAAKRLAEAGTIAIVLPDEPGLEVIASAYAFGAGLRAIGKTVTVFAPPALPTRSPVTVFPEDSNEPLREFVISFDLTRSPITELKYERDANRLNIILSPAGGRLRREDVEFRYGTLRYDLAVTIGVPTIEAAAASMVKAPELLHQKPILNIDGDPSNRHYGEINLVPAEAPAITRLTLPELIHGLLGALGHGQEEPPGARG